MAQLKKQAALPLSTDRTDISNKAASVTA